MKKNSKQVVITILTLLLFIIVSFSSTAQAQELPKADNTIHDKIYYLIQKSKAIVLPAEVLQRITATNANNPTKDKAAYSQSNVLKVLYNTSLSKDERLFFGNHMLKSNAAPIIAIHPEIKKLLTNL